MTKITKYKNKKTGEIIDIEDYEEVKEPLRFEDIEARTCFYYDHFGDLREDRIYRPSSSTTGYPTKELAMAFHALRKLLWLRHEITEGREPDGNDGEVKYCIVNCGGEAGKVNSRSQPYPLSFPTEDMAYEFMGNYKDLIEKALPLL